MNYVVFTPIFPTLEGKTIRLREVQNADLPVLYTLLCEPDVVQNYCIEGGFKRLEDVRHIYLTCARANYQSKTQIQWLLEEKATGRVIGIRDLFVDNPVKPITVQGFTGKAYRRRGFSKEAYSLILDYTRQHGATGLMANTSVENFAAIALLFSVGFKPEFVAFTKDDLRMVFKNDYTFEDNYFFADADLKRLYIFCKMYLHAIDIDITDSQPIKRDGSLHKGYIVGITSKNTVADTAQGMFVSELVFASDGVVVMSIDEGVPHVSYLDGRTALLNTWGLCWQECRA